MSKLPADPRTHLQSLPAAQHPRLAQSWLRTASDAWIAGQDEDLRLYLLQTALSVVCSDKHEIAGRVFANSPLDHAFMSRTRDVAEATANWFTQQPHMRELKRDWPVLSHMERRDRLQHLADRVAQLHGIPPAPVHLIDEPIRGGYIRNAFYDPQARAITLNVNPDAAFDRMIDAAAIVVHEMAHHQQWHMIDRLQAGHLQPSGELYKTAAWFYLNNLPGLYQRPADGMANYLHQPTEHHAFAAEAGFLGAVRKTMPDQSMFRRFFERATTPGMAP